MKPSLLADLATAVSSRELTAKEIIDAAKDLLDATAADDLKADFLRAWARRGETAAELAACAEAFLPQAVDPCVRGSWKGKPLLDCCGTGGGGLNLLNISTGLMFILAAMGVPVVKHGNRGITKRSGSADVLEAMGIKIDLPPDQVTRCLEEVGCAFLFAPKFHPAFAAVAGVRKTLGTEGQRTVFNLLGPLLNPARPEARLVGVFKPEHVALYKETLEKMGCPRFTIACGQDEKSQKLLGEVSAQGATLFGSTLRWEDDTPVTHMRDSIFPPTTETVDSLLVRNADESASRLETIFSGEDQGLDRDTLLINAAFASWTHGTSGCLEEGIAEAAAALDSGRALAVMKRWQNFSDQFGP